MFEHMFSKSLLLASFLGRFCAQGKLSIELLPTVEFDAADKFGGMMYFKVADPTTTNQSCSTSCSLCAAPGDGWSEQTNCGGYISLDLSAHSELQISFKAPAGYEIEIDGLERSRIEFQAKVPCASDATTTTTAPVQAQPGTVPSSPTFPGGGGFKHQEVSGSEFTPAVTGTNIAPLNYNAESSFVQLGRCDGCDQCEVYTRVQYDAPIQGARFSEISWTISYDASNTVDGAQDYFYGTELYSWIRGATLPESGAARRLTADFAGNEFKLIKLESVASQSASFGCKAALVVTLMAAFFAPHQH